MPTEAEINEVIFTYLRRKRPFPQTFDAWDDTDELKVRNACYYLFNDKGMTPEQVAKLLYTELTKDQSSNGTV